ncbi:GT1 domain-containing protein isoform X3 [Tachysurus vachellii]|uniref:GT1 domain-containing protein isoform X3 n=1 Tax=Tachysurus vachellii TaxID=175792 RepID=UPI00296AA7F6|nr:GT1 domain-containing protein isoform X3 [Tachysurus vachellii]
MARERAAFFSPFEQEIIMKTFEEYKHIIRAKCNTAAAAKSRVEAWQNIADRLNDANPNNIKRTWQQVKIKYKNIVQCANRKRKQKFGEGSTTNGFSPAEEVALWQIRGRPVIDGTILGLSSEHTGVGVGRPTATEPENSTTLIQTAPTVLDCAEEHTESDSEQDEKNIVVCSHPEEGNEAYTSQEDPGPSGPSGPAVAEFYLQRDEDVTALYKRYLRQEIAYRQLKMKKLEKEIQLLDKQLDVS